MTGEKVYLSSSFPNPTFNGLFPCLCPKGSEHLNWILSNARLPFFIPNWKCQSGHVNPAKLHAWHYWHTFCSKSCKDHQSRDIYLVLLTFWMEYSLKVLTSQSRGFLTVSSSVEEFRLTWAWELPAPILLTFFMEVETLDWGSDRFLCRA